MGLPLSKWELCQIVSGIDPILTLTFAQSEDRTYDFLTVTSTSIILPLLVQWLTRLTYQTRHLNTQVAIGSPLARHHSPSHAQTMWCHTQTMFGHVWLGLGVTVMVTISHLQ